MKHLLEKLRARFNAATDKHDAEMPVTMKNYILLLAGFVVIIIGGSDSPDQFNYAMFSWRRITLAPILVVGGFAFEIYALLKRF